MLGTGEGTGMSVRLIDISPIGQKLKDAIHLGKMREDAVLELKAILADIEAQPTIDLVQCKDCENWDTDWIPSGYTLDDHCHYCTVMDLVTNEADWCSQADRKEASEWIR